MQNDRSKIAGRRTNAMPGLRAALALAGALFACGCNTDQQVAGVPDVPPDYRMRHPITMKKPTVRLKSSSAPIVASSMRRSAPRCSPSASSGGARRPAALSSTGRSGSGNERAAAELDA